MREFRVVVTEFLLKPRPIGRRRAIVQIHQPRDEGVARLAHEAVTAQAAQIGMDANQAERPGARRREL